MNLEDDILIERFLRNELSQSEATNFLQKLNDDPVFKEHFLLEKQLFEALDKNNWSFVENIDSKKIEEYDKMFRSKESRSLEKTLAEVSKTYKKENKTKKRRLFYLSGIAATILLILTLNVFNSTKSPESYYNDYIMLNDLPSFINRGDVSDKEKLITAEKYFQERKFKEALMSLEEVSNSELKDGNYYVYKALSFIELNEYDKAEKTLDILTNSDFIDAPKGYWYKALLFLKTKQSKKAVKQLHILLEKSEYKNKEAKEILKDIE